MTRVCASKMVLVESRVSGYPDRIRKDNLLGNLKVVDDAINDVLTNLKIQHNQYINLVDVALTSFTTEAGYYVILTVIADAKETI